jgi:hypothetical protein
MNDLDPTTNPDVQEALSRRYSDDIIILLPLRSGAIGVFNSARELCGFIDDPREFCTEGGYSFSAALSDTWEPPKAAPTLTKPPVDLEELDLI